MIIVLVLLIIRLLDVQGLAEQAAVAAAMVSRAAGA